jgi:hypothetical protein
MVAHLLRGSPASVRAIGPYGAAIKHRLSANATGPVKLEMVGDKARAMLKFSR